MSASGSLLNNRVMGPVTTRAARTKTTYTGI